MKPAPGLSRKGVMQSHCALANEALNKFTIMLYEWDTDGVWANIDNRTGRLLVPAPWGSSGWKVWGLQSWAAVVLRSVLMARVGKARHIPLFDYSPEQRHWFLNIVSYPSLDKAGAYLHHCSISLAEWRQYTTAYHNRTATAQQRYRDARKTVE